jgi:pantoate--beta-alanine ligase
MEIVKTAKTLRDITRTWRLAGEKIAFVPTMGNLHDGHLSLVETARQHADRVVVSIFVNPTQFGEGEDYASYPRSENEDIEKLTESAVDLVFMPSVKEIYPAAALVSLNVSGISERWCGASRPGHFNGVATIVCKLFNLVQPDIAVFGEKDFQQLAIIRQMVTDLNFPVEIIGAPIIREPDGLALSSRNGYLTSEQRRIAPELYRSLTQIADEIMGGNTDFESLCLKHCQHLDGVGFKVDYLVVCQAQTLEPATQEDRELIILVAAWLGRPRLIDNLPLKR